MNEPLWRQLFDLVERQVAPRAEAVVNSEPFADAVGTIAGVRRLLRREAARSTRRWLHLWNLPAGSDIRRLMAEVGQLRRQVGALHDEMLSGEEAARVRAVQS